MIVYGHRGAKGEAPENTLASFRHAYRHGIRHFELDLLLSKDGVPVIIHDQTLERTTGHSGKVADLTAAELAKLDARRNTSPWPKPTGVPSLVDFLEAFPDLEHVQLEVKTDSRHRLNILCNRLTELVQRNKLVNRVAITSSDTWFLQETKRRDRTIRTGLVADRRFPNPLKQALRLKCDYLCLNWRICSTAMVEAAHQRDLHVSTWTVNRIHDMLELEKRGVDSIITDFPTSTHIYFQNRDSTLQLRLPERGKNQDEPATTSP
ncbi:MAG: glycerophosphodiester phosphodiesterase [Marinobacter sp.]|uniref:glycerophosphodiester phosphodiesterase n=1 Tax=Marinobacter sp. TaxID=50741 RepID=UPI00299DFC2A|nr:glycerophosphodiester phosphodiesterase [Marinobacter sp.]MDX1633378.1 glycerophosphodiester phosphodiesterase [Marinobacter sp.]